MLRKVLGTGASIALMMIFTLASGVATSRLLGPADRGTLVSLTLWPSVIALLADLGSSIAITRKAAGNAASDSTLTGAVLAMSALTAALAPAGYLLVSLSLRSDGFTVHLLGFILLLVYAPLVLATRLFSAISLGKGHLKHYNLARLTGPLVWALGSVGLFILDIASLIPLVVVLTFSGLASTAVGAYPYRSSTLRIPVLSDFRFAGTCVRENISAHVGNTAPIDSMKLDVAAVSIMSGASAVGNYSVASATAYVMRLMGHVLGVIGLPLTAKTETRSDAIDSSRRVALLSIGTSAAAGLIIVPLLPIAIRFLYGSEFESAIAPAQILCIGVAFAGVRQALSDCLRGFGVGAASSWGEVGSWIVAVLAFVYLVPRHGVLGAAIATTITYVVALIMTIIAANMKYAVPWERLVLPTSSDISLLRRAFTGRLQQSSPRSMSRVSREAQANPSEWRS